MATNGINEAFNAGFKVKLQNRGANSSGITFELKSVFDELAKQGLIKDTDGKGLTKQEALNLYAKLNEIHEATKRATNYTKMQVGQEFTYTADEMKALAQAAGYEVVEQSPTVPLKKSVDELPPLESPVSPSDMVGIDINSIKLPTPETPDVLADENNLDSPEQKTFEEQIEDRGGKIINRFVDGKESEIVVMKNNNEKNRYQVITDENGNKSVGEKLYTVSTAGKNTYVTETQHNKNIQDLGFDPSNIPDGVTFSYVSMGGKPVLVAKKDGKTMNAEQIKDSVAEPLADVKPEVKLAILDQPPLVRQNPEADKVEPEDELAVSDYTHVVKQKPEADKNYSNEEIMQNINNLKPGEEFRYQHKWNINWGTGSSSGTEPVIWKRLDDGTLTKTTKQTYTNSHHRLRFAPFVEHYSSDGKTKLSQEFSAESLKFFPELRTTTNYNNGGAIVDTVTDLTNMAYFEKQQEYHPVDKLLSSIAQLPPRYSELISSQEIKNKNGETVLSFKDGQFINQKGKVINYESAAELIGKLYTKNELASLVQTYKAE